MSKRLYKIIEIIGVLIIFLIIYRLFPFVNIILKYIFKIIMPFLIAFSIAFIFEPFIVFLEKKKINRKIAIGFIVGLFILILYLLIRFAIPLFIKQLGMLIEMLPDYLNRLEEIIQNITNKFQKLPGNLHIDYDKIESILNEKLSKTIETFTSTLQRSFSYIIQFLITPILAIYFLNDYQKIEQKIKDKLINNKKIVLYDRFRYVGNICAGGYPAGMADWLDKVIHPHNEQTDTGNHHDNSHNGYQKPGNAICQSGGVMLHCHVSSQFWRPTRQSLPRTVICYKGAGVSGAHGR